jgi:hypothetical protein
VDKPLTTNRDLFKVITTAHLLRMKSADMDTIELLFPPPSLKKIMKPMFLHLRMMERNNLRLKRDFARRRIEQRHIEAVRRGRSSQVTRHSALVFPPVSALASSGATAGRKRLGQSGVSSSAHRALRRSGEVSSPRVEMIEMKPAG